MNIVVTIKFLTNLKEKHNKPMAKIIITKVNSCSDCPHIDHTGAFTPGGAKYCCRHSGIARSLKQNKYGVALLPDTETIPRWCPL